MKRLLEQLFPSLGKKVAFAVVAVILIAGGGFVYFAHRTGYSILDQEMETKANGVASLMGGVLDEVMLDGKHERLQKALLSATTAPDILDAYVLTTHGDISLRAKAGNSDRPFPIERFCDVIGTSHEKMISVSEEDTLVEYVVAPILKRQVCVTCHTEPELVRGYFAMKISMNDVRSAALEHRTVNILLTILVFGGLGLVIFLALSILVIKPINRLHSHIRRVEGGVDEMEHADKPPRFPLLPEMKGNDEIADLCCDFNNLLRRLNDANDRLFDLHHQQLEYADRLATTGQMAASMAHEIKNPIAGVLGALQVFDADTPTDDPRKEILAEMMIQLERITHAVNDLLSYARPTPPVFEPVRVNDVIRKTLSLVGAQTRGRSIAVRTSLVDEPAVIDADRKQLQQVLWNIVLNATQAMDTVGTLTITSQSKDSIVDIRISDTGKGISKEDLDSIFVPFFTTKHKGTGLGMTISKRLVEQHRGTLIVDSEIGRGTTVTIRLPQRQV